jgi:hypothetical protein
MGSSAPGILAEVARLPEDVRSAFRFFAFFLANGTVDVELLDEIDYLPALRQPSVLEQVFAIFSNVLDIGPDGMVTNGDQAKLRAAQYLRRCMDPTYVVEPPFEQWELELL